MKLWDLSGYSKKSNIQEAHLSKTSMGKESITMSMELAKTQCYEFKGFQDNYLLTISTQGCRIDARKFNTKGT